MAGLWCSLRRRRRRGGADFHGDAPVVLGCQRETEHKNPQEQKKKKMDGAGRRQVRMHSIGQFMFGFRRGGGAGYNTGALAALRRQCRLVPYNAGTQEALLVPVTL